MTGHTFAFSLLIASAVFIAYTLVGYRLLLQIVVKMWSRPHQRGDYEPTVTLIIAVHNAEKAIAKKIENCLALHYPAEKMRMIVATDGSTDRTGEIVQGYRNQRVMLVAAKERRGKHHVQKLAIDRSDSEIVVFTDASIMLKPNAVAEIVKNFADPGVGCVSSEDAFPQSDAASGEATYVSSEMSLRRLEAEIGSTVGATGGFFAARRSLCQTWHLNQSSDFFVPLHAAAAGLRTVVDPMAVAEYHVGHEGWAEFNRKVRTIVHGIVVFAHHVYLLDLSRYGFFAVQLVSHKLFRWFLPFGFAGFMVATALLVPVHPIFLALLIAQFLGYALAVLTFVAPASTRLMPLRLLNFLSLSLAASLMAWFRYAVGERYIVWKPTVR
jgi:glycosyltransferase involved in cell wall biosynthesis